ncbi:MAG: MFS transporter [Dysgonamonadaceae bacterium]|jgi:PAT family beta-lactamase induction signal transducer AmpG|nr:MFS transporter [Dysgonamonadaceae bacterium]
MKNKKNTSPWAWVPSLYLAEGLPNVAVTTVSIALYTKMGLSTIDIALYTSLLAFPWVIKPLWSPFVDLLKTKRWWILITQLLIGAGFAGVAFSIPTTFYLQATIAFFYLLAFSSATHDIAADGFYMLELDDNQQAAFVGIRSTFYKVAVVIGQGALLYLAGYLERITGNIKFAWSTVFFVLAGLFILFNLYHHFALPKPSTDAPNPDLKSDEIMKEFIETFVSFFKKPHILTAIFFMLTFRFAEAQLQKLIIPFLDAPVEKGGLDLTMEDIGIIYGTVGIIALALGGIIGGIVASRGGLKKWIWPMTLSMILTCLSFVYLSFAQPQNLLIINICIVVEQFGYGFGFTAYTLYMIYFSEGKRKTSHYAICTGIMALGLILPGMFAGWMQNLLGYKNFFVWVMICGIIPIISVSLLKIDPTFGKKKEIK